MTHDKSAGDGPTAYDCLLLLRQEWVGSEGPLLRATLRELGKRPLAEYREGLGRVFTAIFDRGELEKLYQILIPLGDEAHMWTLALAVQKRRKELAAIAKAGEEFDAMMKRDFPGYVVVATGRLPS